MEKLLGKDKNNIINLIFTIVLFAAGAAVILYFRLRNLDYMVGPYIWPDQMGYYTHAAVLAGLPWYETTDAWYAWGTSVILAIIYKITTIGYIAYRLAIIVNAFTGLIGYILGIIFVKEINEKLDNKIAIIASTVAFSTTSYIIQSEIVWAECFVQTLFMLVMVLGVYYAKKPTIPRVISLTASVCALFVFHNRTIVVIIALLMYVGLIVIATKDKKFLLQLAIVLLMIFALYRGNAFVKYKLKGMEGTPVATTNYVSSPLLAFGFSEADNDQVIIKDEAVPTADYSEAQVSNGNDLSGRLFNIKFLFKDNNARIGLVESFLGGTWYLLFSGFMIGWFGVTLLFRKSYLFFKKSGTIADRQEAAGYIFIILCIGAALLLSAVNAMWYPEYVLASTGNIQLEMLFYGRYIEMLTAPLILLGFANISNKGFGKQEIIELAAGIIYMLLVTAMINYEATQYPDASINIVVVSAIYHWLDMGYFKMSFMAICIGAVVYALFKLHLPDKHKLLTYVFAIIAAALMCTVSIKGLESPEDVIYAMEMSLKNYDEMVGLLENNNDITLVVDDVFTATDRFYRIRTRCTTTYIGADDSFLKLNDQCFFLVEPYMAEDIKEYFSRWYDNLYITQCGEYPLIIKGDELADRLISQGYEVKK